MISLLKDEVFFAESGMVHPYFIEASWSIYAQPGVAASGSIDRCTAQNFKVWSSVPTSSCSGAQRFWWNQSQAIPFEPGCGVSSECWRGLSASSQGPKRDGSWVWSPELGSDILCPNDWSFWMAARDIQRLYNLLQLLWISHHESQMSEFSDVNMISQNFLSPTNNSTALNNPNFVGPTNLKKKHELRRRRLEGWWRDPAGGSQWAGLGHLPQA